MLFRPGWAVQVAFALIGVIVAAIALNHVGAAAGAPPVPWVSDFLARYGYFTLPAPLGWLAVTLWLRSRPNLNPTIKNIVFIWGLFLLVSFAAIFVWGIALPVARSWIQTINTDIISE